MAYRSWSAAPEEGAEREGHQKKRGRALGSTRQGDGDRHEKGERPHVVHERRTQSHQPSESGNLYPKRVADPGQQSGHRVDHAGIREPAADDEHGGDRHHGGVAQSREDLVLGHVSSDGKYQERRERNEVVAPAVPDEQNKRRPQDAEDDDLTGAHVVSSEAGCGYRAVRLNTTAVSGAPIMRVSQPMVITMISNVSLRSARR